jgi:glycosyltransferase involved in cell wall biosynthesis
MKILIADILLKSDNSDWKEGYELCYAFRDMGHECDVYGPNGELSELEIPLVANNYDLVIITENYPHHSGWKWWNWESVKTPKLFWAIDTHLINFLPWLQSDNINFVAFNNPQDLDKYQLENSFWMPYGASKKHHMIKYTDEKIRDVVFIGGMIPERQRLCQKFGIEHLNAFGPNYIKEMQASKICFNLSMSYDINAKYFEILSTGTFMLTNYNEYFHKFLDYNEDVEKMFYYSEEDLGEKIKYYLENEEEREQIAKNVYSYIYENHTYENRAKLILENIKNKIKE